MTVQVEAKFDLHRFLFFLEAETWKEWKHSQTITLHTMKTHA